MTTRSTTLLFSLCTACAESSAYEYYRLRAQQQEHDCQCSHNDDQPAIDHCLESTQDDRERERACAIDYVEDSKKHRERVEPIYSRFVGDVGKYIDCFNAHPECLDATFECEEFDLDACVMKHLDGSPDDSLRGLQEILACAAAEETGG